MLKELCTSSVQRNYMKLIIRIKLIINSIQQWYYKRRIFKAIGIKQSFLKKGKWNASSITLKEIERINAEYSKVLAEMINRKSHF